MPTVPTVHPNPSDRVVVYLATRNLYDTLPAAYNSLLHHNPDVRVYLLIEDDSLPFRLPGNVSCVNVSGQTWFPADGANTKTSYTYMALMKATLPHIFPDTHHLLVLDADTIVNDSISELWDYDIRGKYFAGVPEPVASRNRKYTYCNFGVVMLNLAMLGQNGMCDKIITEINKHYHAYPEQEVYNMFCNEHILVLPPTYNDTNIGFNITGSDGHGKITHFAGIKKWNDFAHVRRWVAYGSTNPLVPVYMGNRRYYPHLVAAAKSLLFHTDVDKIYFLTEDDTFPEPLPDCVKIINVSGQKIFTLNGPNIHAHYTYMTTMRAALSKVLPDEDTVLLLDPDTVVVDDISPIRNYDIGQYYFAAVQETRNNDHTHKPYYNAGVMYMNLAKLRADHMDDKIISEINSKWYKHLEQDVLNFQCAGHILDLPSMYNASFVSDECRYPRINHYLSYAKDKLPAAQTPYANLTWDQAITGGHGITGKGATK